MTLQEFKIFLFKEFGLNEKDTKHQDFWNVALIKHRFLGLESDISIFKDLLLDFTFYSKFLKNN